MRQWLKIDPSLTREAIQAALSYALDLLKTTEKA